MSTDPLFIAVQRALAGQYSLEREIGRGGMGVVYLAREVELARLVALKVLPPELASDPAVRHRFLREARTAAGLSHPHIVPIHRVADTGGFVYFSMMYVDGETLGERLRTRGPLSPSAATRMLREVSQALAYAHGRGIVHRDIKPDNILLERESGRALVTDFGIAAASDVHLGIDDPVMGTVHYMSPEQAAGLPVDGRSDLYSLGVVAHVALSGRLPARAVVRSGGTESPGVPSSLAIASPTTPRHLVAAIDRALARDPAKRFPSAEAFADAIDRSTAVRDAVPAPIRAFLSARDPWRLAYVAWAVGWEASLIIDNWSQSWYPMFATAIALVPLIPAWVFELRIARNLMASGYSFDDVQSAVRAWKAERLAELEAEYGRHPAWVGFVGRTLAAVAAVLILADSVAPRFPVVEAFEAVLAAVTIAGIAALPLMSAAGIPILPRSLKPVRSLRQRFWTSAIGRSIDRAFFSGTRGLAPANAFRPTELALGSAVTDLWRSLPAAYRERLDDLPDVVRRLEDHATYARRVLVRLDEGTDSTLDTRELAPVRDRARRELGASVSALESIRLDLLRLLGGDTDLAPMTTALDAARRIGGELSRISEAEREVERIIRPIGLDLRPHTPV